MGVLQVGLVVPVKLSNLRQARGPGLVLQPFPKLVATLARLHHQGGQIQNALGSDLWAHSTSVDVRDEVPVGICVRSFRAVCHINREALRSGQARALSNQKGGNRRLQQLAKLVENARPAVMNYGY